MMANQGLTRGCLGARHLAKSKLQNDSQNGGLQLPLLEVLRIGGMSEVKSIGAEFYGECVNPFASLKELRFVDMPEWESWSHSNFIMGDVGAFPCFQRFVIRKCPKPIGELPK